MATDGGERVEHELKIALQKVIEQDCGHLLATYGFSIRRILAELSLRDDAYRFAVEIYSPQLQKSLTASQLLGRQEAYRMGFNGTYSGSGGATFVYLFHKMASQIKREIEKITKEMPVANQQYQSSGYSIGLSGTAGAHYNSFTASMSEMLSDPGLKQQRLQEQFIQEYHERKPAEKKTTKFEHIDALIADSKKRLTSEYVSPKFQFKHF